MPVTAQLSRQRLNSRWLRKRLLPILGDTRLLWMPRPGDATTALTTETSAGRVVTYDATVAARLSSLGRGYAQTFDGAANYGTTPDTADLSFGNGTTDQAFSIVALANVTDTAASRRLVAKNAASNQEWVFGIGGSDLLTLLIGDQSAGVSAFRLANGAATQGSWRLFGGTYDGTGGATAANGMTLYQDGAVIASVATNDAGYVAMENLAAAVEIGSDTAHTANFMQGSLALVAVCAKALTAADHAAIFAVCRRYFGVP